MASDIKVQIVEVDVPAAGTSVTTGFDAVNSLDHAFVINLMSTPTVGGYADGTTGADLEADDMGIHPYLSATGTVECDRSATASQECKALLAIFEDTTGGDHFTVRGRGEISISSGSYSGTASISGVSNVDDVLPLLQGVLSDETNNAGNATTGALRMTASGTLTGYRGYPNGTSDLRYVAVEFTGSRWRVLHGTQELTTANTDSGTITIGTDADGEGTGVSVGAWAQALIFGQYKAGPETNNALANLACQYERGSALDEVDWSFNAGHNNNAGTGDQPARVIVHVLEDTDGDMNVTVDELASATPNAGGYNFSTWTDVAHGASPALTDIETSLALISNTRGGSGAGYMRQTVGVRLDASTIANYDVWIGRSGNAGTAYVQVADFEGVESATPVSLTGPGVTSTDAAGTGSLQLDVTLEGSGTSSTETAGTGSFTPDITLSGSGVTETATAGTGELQVPVTLSGSGASSAESVGTGSFVTPVTLEGSGVSSSETPGSGAFDTDVDLVGPGAASSDSSGSGSLQLAVTLEGSGVLATNSAGNGSFQVAVTLSGSGVTSSETPGDGSFTPDITLSGSGVTSTETAGTGELDLAGSGFDDGFDNGFGGSTVLSGSGAASTETAGSGSLSTGVDLTGPGATETDTAGSGSLGLAVTLSGDGAIETITIGTGSFTTGVVLEGSGVTEAGTTGSGALNTDIDLIGSGASSTDTPGSGSLSIDTSISLIGPGATETSTAGSGSMVLGITFSGSGSQEDNIVGTGSFDPHPIMSGPGVEEDVVAGLGSLTRLITVHTLTNPTSLAKRADDGLWRHYERSNFTYSVLITGGTAATISHPSIDQINAADAGSGYSDKAVFLGGHKNTVSDAEKTILEAAGYTVTTTLVPE